MKVLRSDRGGECNSNAFDKFCKYISMEKQLMVRYTPQQNGVVKRKNRTIKGMAKSVLHEKALHNTFLGQKPHVQRSI